MRTFRNAWRWLWGDPSPVEVGGLGIVKYVRALKAQGRL